MIHVEYDMLKTTSDTCTRICSSVTNRCDMQVLCLLFQLCIQNRQWLNVFTYMLFYVWSFGFFVPHIGWTKTLVHWMITR